MSPVIGHNYNRTWQQVLDPEPSPAYRLTMTDLRGTLFVLLGVAGVLVTASHAEGQSAPQRVVADLERYYYRSAANEIAARTTLSRALAKLDARASHIATGADLLWSLQAYDTILRQAQHHDVYLHMVCARNRREPACEARRVLAGEVDSKTAILRDVVLRLPSGRLSGFLGTTPGLAPFRYPLAVMRQEAAHVLPLSVEKLLDDLQPELVGWQDDVYQQVLATADFGTVTTAAGNLDVLQEYDRLLADSDSVVRKTAFYRTLSARESRRDLLALTLLRAVRVRQKLARLHAYADAPDAKYQSLLLDPAATRRLLAALGDHGVILKKYELAQQTHFVRTHHTAAHAWDGSAPDPACAPSAVKLSELPALLHRALTPLGPIYLASLDSLFAPDNRRVDIVEHGAPNRYRSGFSIGGPSSTSMVFFGVYDGTFEQISAIAHEGGHAVHRSLMSGYVRTALDTQGPHFLFESFAEFNELLLADELAAQSTSPGCRRFYKSRWLGAHGLDALWGAQDALLEQAVYDGVAAGTINTADDLDRATVGVDSLFSSYPSAVPELRGRWMGISLFYEDPLYNVNYAYAGLLAVKYYQLYLADPQRFGKRYVALLKNGFDAPPEALLKRFLGIDLDDVTLVEDDMGFLARRIDELGALDGVAGRESRP
jgi:oligoendopeptidase F